MPSWVVFCPALREYDASRPSDYETVTADQKFVLAGVLQFLNLIPEPPPPVIELCEKEFLPKKICIRVKGHTGKHMDRLKPKFVRPKMIGIRDFNTGAWMDCKLVEGA